MAERRLSIRGRWWVRWRGVVVCCLIGGLWGVSAFFQICWGVRDPGGVLFMSVDGGCLEYVSVPAAHLRPLGRTLPPDADYFGEVRPLRPAHWMDQWRPTVDETGWTFPLWIPLSIIALWTMWRFTTEWWRRRWLGHCSKCHYDLKGNVSGICPECGTPARPAVGTAGEACRLPCNPTC